MKGVSVLNKERLDTKTLINAIEAQKIGVKTALEKVTIQFLEELKQYRDLEEQGLLLRLPVAVGSKVYEIIEETVSEHYYYISEYEVEDVSTKAVMYADDWYDFNYPNLYFDRETAEEKLRELEGK